MRTFVAIELKAEVKKMLLNFMRKLDRHNPNIRWVKDQGMHLTLKFIGEITEEKAENIRTALDTLHSKHERFLLKLVGTGTFPPRSRHPRILWIGIEENQELISLQNAIESSLEKLSISREKRKFFPHLTLGRVKSDQNIARVLEELSSNKDTEFGSQEVESITFFRSILKPTGADYKSLMDVQLK
jgi:2'-5' RNA ligase